MPKARAVRAHSALRRRGQNSLRARTSRPCRFCNVSEAGSSRSCRRHELFGHAVPCAAGGKTCFASTDCRASPPCLPDFSLRSTNAAGQVQKYLPCCIGGDKRGLRLRRKTRFASTNSQDFRLAGLTPCFVSTSKKTARKGGFCWWRSDNLKRIIEIYVIYEVFVQVLISIKR